MQILEEKFNTPQKNAVFFWLLMAVGSLALSGIYSIIIVFARTPQIAEMLPVADMFHKALVVHVDMLVLGWFLAFYGLFSAKYFMRHAESSTNAISSSESLVVYACGLLLLFFAPINLDADAIMSNYIPVINGPIFFGALGFITLSVLLLTFSNIRAFFKYDRDWAIIALSAIMIMALLEFGWSYISVPQNLRPDVYFENLFWSGGHLLQYVHNFIMILCLLALSQAAGIKYNEKALYALFALGFIAPLFAFVPSFFHEVVSPEYASVFTENMKYWGASQSFAFLFLFIYALANQTDLKLPAKPILYSLIFGVILYTEGGILGWMIQEENVVIPAHYHGSIVGITLIFMAFCYHLSTTLGFGEILESRWAKLQPIIYGTGQIIHITALAVSGGYGVLRKTPGAVPGGEGMAQVYMGLMGFGGLLAIIGGVIFVVLFLRHLFRQL